MDVKPDIVHTNNLSGISCAVWQKAKKYKCRVIHTSRDYYLIHQIANFIKMVQKCQLNRLRYHYGRFQKKILGKNVDVYVGISNYIKDKHIEAGF
ncbi:glycosyltransferase [Klebsiella pneumoniae]|uniref:glycosyltransferase n=1 Tax=Klebsiella pneumoniae TaxID=573 RepID=UPI003B3AA025